MKHSISVAVAGLALSALTGCDLFSGGHMERSFDEDVAFLAAHGEVVVLGSQTTGARVAVVPAWQGRVMTSTAGGAGAPGYGWINYDLIAAGRIQPHINPYGGEDRFWVGPEGGQFSVFFQGGDPFDFEHWQTPALIDTEPFELVSKNATRAVFRRDGTLTNYSGTKFHFHIDRTIALLDSTAVRSFLGMDPPAGVRAVAYRSENQITNTGTSAWTKEKGLLSIWILGMFKPSPGATVVVPFQSGPESERGQIVNDVYFGKVPPERLRIAEGILFFKADSRHRSKIGLNPLRAKSLAGSYDPERNLLTIVSYSRPEGARDYVNSLWKLQDDPYGGDVVNSYNDGPTEPGGEAIGGFYELETSSPAAALAPGASIQHIHATYHFTGSAQALDPIARKLLGVSLETITSAL